MPKAYVLRQARMPGGGAAHQNRALDNAVCRAGRGFKSWICMQ
jgi:hypothetical protein